MKKRLCSIVIVAAIFMQALSNTVFAADEEVSIKIPSKIPAGTTLALDIKSSDTDFSYQWLSADSVDGEYMKLTSDTDSKYVVTPRDKNKYIKAEITNLNNGNVILSNNAAYIENLGPVSRTSFSETQVEETMLTPKKHIFSVGSQKFILLEETNDDGSHYYVMTENLYGTRAFDVNNNAKFSPTVNGNIGQYLNNEFIEEGTDGLKFPQKIIDNIDFNHIWCTEAGKVGGDCSSDYHFTCGISLLSSSEAIKYHGKYGWQPLGEDKVTPWWSRTQRGANGIDDNILVMMNTNDGGKGNMWDRPCTTSSYYLRPTFYLEKDFFKNVKCELENTGDEIKSLILNRYTLDEMKLIYNTEELIALGYEIKSATITANETQVKALTKLTAKLSDKNAVKFDYQWYVSDSDTVIGEKVCSNYSDTYIIATNDMGKWISVVITPVYNDGSSGEKVEAINKIYVDKLGDPARSDYSSEERIKYKNNPIEYLFTAGGEQLILLDAFDNDKSAIYAMTADTKGIHQFDVDKTQKFNPEDKNNIAFWLNNDFLTEDVSINSDVQKYIDKDYVWWTEKGNVNGNCKEDYSVEAGVGLLSRSEYSKYWGKFGWDNNESIKTAWWLRTGRSTGASDIFCGTGVKDGNFADIKANGYGNTWNKAADTNYFVRPTFYLNRDFMLNIKVTAAGIKVVETMKNLYSVDELLSCNAGYTKNDLLKMGIIESPIAKDISVSGLAAVNAELVGVYQYSSEKPEGNSSYGFEISDNGKDNYIKICDAKTIKLTEEMKEKYIRFFVVPCNSDSELGDKCYSEAIKVIGTAKIAAENIKVTDENGGKVVSLSTVKKLNTEVTFVNYTSEKKTVCGMLFIYDVNNNMLDNGAVFVEVDSGERVAVDNLSIKLPAYTNGNYVKLIIWDGLTTMQAAQNSALLFR